jgi:hypothetical protein
MRIFLFKNEDFAIQKREFSYSKMRIFLFKNEGLATQK